MTAGALVLSRTLPAENEAEIVGRHRIAFGNLQPVTSREFRDLFEVTDTPIRISPFEIGIKGFVAWSRMGAVLAVGAVEVEHASG